MILHSINISFPSIVWHSINAFGINDISGLNWIDVSGKANRANELMMSMISVGHSIHDLDKANRANELMNINDISDWLWINAVDKANDNKYLFVWHSIHAPEKANKANELRLSYTPYEQKSR